MNSQRERELLDKARHLYQKGQSQLALQIVRQVLQSNPTSEQGWLLLAYLVRKDKQKAIYCLRKVLSINPNNQEARLALAKYQQSRKSTLSQKHEKKKGGDRMQQLVVGGVVGVVLLLSIVVGVLAISLKRSASYVQPQRPIAPITLPPTWTPQVPTSTPTPTRTSTPKPSPTSSYCPKADVQLYIEMTSSLLGEIHDENKAMDAVGGPVGALSSPRVSSQIAQWTQQHIDDAKKFPVPPCLQKAHQFFLEFLQYRYNTFAEAARGHYQSALDWVQRSDAALQQWSQAADEAVNH